MVNYHIPVLKEEVLHFLSPQGRHLIVDGTLGDGGHTQAILENTGPECRVLAIDRDPEALKRAWKRLSAFKERVTLVHGNFSEIESILSRENIGKMDGFLLDLGVSSAQLGTPERGFSFQNDGPLDMRMNPQDDTTAADLLNTLSDSELNTIFRKYGEEWSSKKIIRYIRKAQGTRPIATTFELSKILSSAVGSPRPARIHPATKAFQALRIAVNRELDHLDSALNQSIELMNEGGRTVVIAFHSLEDRIVKDVFRTEQKGCVCPPKIPVCICGRVPRLRVLTRRVVKPSSEEVSANPRASSARLRAAERVYA